MLSRFVALNRDRCQNYEGTSNLAVRAGSDFVFRFDDARADNAGAGRGACDRHVVQISEPEKRITAAAVVADVFAGGPNGPEGTL